MGGYALGSRTLCAVLHHCCVAIRASALAAGTGTQDDQRIMGDLFQSLRHWVGIVKGAKPIAVIYTPFLHIESSLTPLHLCIGSS